jgi:hypothetical protein
VLWLSMSGPTYILVFVAERYARRADGELRAESRTACGRDSQRRTRLRRAARYHLIEAPEGSLDCGGQREWPLALVSAAHRTHVTHIQPTATGQRSMSGARRRRAALPAADGGRSRARHEEHSDGPVRNGTARRPDGAHWLINEREAQVRSRTFAPSPQWEMFPLGEPVVVPAVATGCYIQCRRLLCQPPFTCATNAISCAYNRVGTRNVLCSDLSPSNRGSSTRYYAVVEAL